MVHSINDFCLLGQISKSLTFFALKAQKGLVFF